MTLLFATYFAVLTAELVGDKTLYTISILAMRYKLLPMICGLTLAFMAKMAVAIMVGNAISDLPPSLITGITATVFFAMALSIWLRKPQTSAPESEQLTYWPHGALVAFAAVFFTEWGDFGQITAATLTAKYHEPTTVWVGSTLAMMTKAAFAILLGVSLRERVPVNIFRYAAVCVCVSLGFLSVFRIEI